MSFGFLYPLAWLGALAVVAPIWLHLRRRQDARLVRFSATQFLDFQPAARSRPLWPQNWPLLLLRLLALLLLVAAFAWPYLPVDEKVVIHESRVYILDNTLSQQAGDGWSRARDELVEEIQDLGLETQVAVIELRAEPHVLVEFDDYGQSVADVLEELKPSYQRGSYLAAFRLADELLRRSLGARRRVILLGDSQENQWAEGTYAPSFLDDVDVTLPTVRAATSSNLALRHPSTRQVFLGDQTRAECSVELFHQGASGVVEVVFRVDGEEVRRTPVDLAGKPATLTLSAQWPSDLKTWQRGEVVLEEPSDALPADDRVVFALAPTKEGSVGLWSSSRYVRAALSPEVMQGRWQVHDLAAEEPADRQRTAKELDVLWMDSNALESAAAGDLAKRLLQSGRGVVLEVNRISPAVLRFLRSQKIEFVAEASEPTARTGFRYVYLEHPVFRPFVSADLGDLMNIRVLRHRRLKHPQSMPLVFSDTGDPLLFESEGSGGRLLTFAFSLDRLETTWPLHPTFVPLLDRCLKHVQSEFELEREYRPGETCIWKVPVGRETQHVLVDSDVNSDAPAPTRAAVERGRAVFRVPERPGLYALRYDADAAVESLLAVNPPPLESHLRYVNSPPVLEQWRRKDQENNNSDRALAGPLDLATNEILQQRIWWWLLLGGLGALVVETCWLALRKDEA